VQAADTVSISGNVVDESGNPVAGATVHYSNAARTQRDKFGHSHLLEGRISSHVVTGKDGTFSISGIPASLYFLCADGVRTTQLGSCTWGKPATDVNLRSASSASGIRLVLTEGVTMTFNIQDNGAKIRDFAETPVVNGAPAERGNFRIFVLAHPRAMSPARLVSAAGNVRQYSLTVPKSRDVQLLFDTQLSLNDSSVIGTSVVSSTLANSISIGTQPVTLQFSVQ
jgi:hypothetical protein